MRPVDLDVTASTTAIDPPAENARMFGTIKKILQSKRSVADNSIAMPKSIDDFPRDLHLGCGGRRAPEMCNVDITPQASVDIVDNVMTLEKFPMDWATSIYACHVLEHFSHAESVEVLKTWYRVLAPGGIIRISVPDIDRIVKIYHKNWEHFQTDSHSPWIGLLYGGQTDQYDFHKTGWNFCWMTHIMRDIGYVEMQEYPHEPHFIGGDFWDNSLAHEPFGEFLSLNMLAKKPSTQDS